MARSVSWRRECSDVVRRRIEEALQMTLYIVHQTGPTGFVVKEDGRCKKFKVFLGDPHSCSCTGFAKDKELCVHILWLLLKRYRVSQENPIVFQLALVEREVNELVHGHLRKQKEAVKETNSNSTSLPSLLATKKPLGPDDICPICQEDLLASPMALTHCRYGCGNSIHLKCMKIWADHQKSTGEMLVRCPLCREDFGSIEDAKKEYSSHQRTHHMHVTCNSCRAHPISGARYKCTSCTNYNLCESCFTTSSTHCHHCQFRTRKLPHSKWTTVTRQLSGSMVDDVADDLQHRELTENDYDLLLQLDSRPLASRAITSTTDRLISSFPVEALDHGNSLLASQCNVCQRSYHRGDWICTLPCTHKFHRRCIVEWLREGHHVCPTDGISVHTNKHMRRQSKKKKEQLVTHPGRDSLLQDFSLVGHSALSVSSSLSSNGQAPVGRVLRGLVSQYSTNGRPHATLPQLVVGMGEHQHKTGSHHHQNPVRKSSVHKPLPNMASPDPSINITGVPITSNTRYVT